MYLYVKEFLYFSTMFMNFPQTRDEKVIENEYR